MAYETKVILTLLAHQVVKSKNLREAYTAIEAAANTEGIKLPTFDELLAEYGLTESQEQV